MDILEDKIIKAEKVAWRELRWLQSEHLKQVVDLDALVNSLVKNGLIRGFHIWEDETGKRWILDGHHMEKALKTIEAKELLTIPDMLTGYFVKCENRQQAGKMVLLFSSTYARMTADGALAHLKDFELDPGLIQDEINLPDFNFEEADRIVQGLQDQAARDQAGDAEPMGVHEPPANPISKPGDVFTFHGNQTEHRVICGDAQLAEIWEKLEEAPAQGRGGVAMITDPPYGVKYDANWRSEAGGYDRRPAFKLGNRVVGKVEGDDQVDWGQVLSHFQGDILYYWHASKYTHEVAATIEAQGFELINLIVWAKHHFVIGRGDYHHQHEPLWYAVRKGKGHNWQGSRKEATVWEIKMNDFTNHEREETYGHSTQKPLECMLRPITNNTAPGQWVVDPFLGSGTTLIAALHSRRNSLGIEINPAYVDIIVARFTRYNRHKINAYFEIYRNGTLLESSEIDAFVNNVSVKTPTPPVMEVDGDPDLSF